jgi:hypothetical protein
MSCWFIGVTRRSYYPLWGVDAEVNEDVVVERVATLLLLKIYQHVCHYCHYLLKVRPFVNNFDYFYGERIY